MLYTSLMLSTLCSCLGTNAEAFDGRLQVSASSLTSAHVYLQRFTATHGEWAKGGRERFHKALRDMEPTKKEAAIALDKAIDEFTKKQAGSEDACHSQLFEAKQQLNKLHEHLYDLARQVNSTDREITVLAEEYSAKEAELADAEKAKNEGLAKCEKEKAKNSETLATLRAELKEMKQIASPNVTLTMPPKGPTVLTQTGAKNKPMHA